MKYLWFIFFLFTMACIGMAYIFNDILDYFFPKTPQTEIILASPEGQS